jgi:predicted metal-dependent hydrolase
LQYQLLRSKRKTIAISFDRDGNLIVKAPLWVAKRETDRFVESKRDWILATSKRLQMAREKEAALRLQLENGDELYYLGEKRVLIVVREDRSRTKIKDVCGRLVMTVPYEADYAYKREQLEKWYRKQALCVFKEKAREFAVTIGVSFQDIHIKDQKSRWGSCSSKGNLNFNWRILMAPEPVCDYVIIHELCHLVYMDHSADFWHLVEQLCPSYRQYKKWLRDRADLLYKF